MEGAERKIQMLNSSATHNWLKGRFFFNLASNPYASKGHCTQGWQAGATADGV
jgi:hypothetical protein